MEDIKLYIEFTENQGKEVKILYAGKFEHGLYGKFEVTEKDLDDAVNNFSTGVGARIAEDGNFELPFNYQHASHEPDPEAAKASGWIRNLIKRGRDLFARVQWTEKAIEYIKNKEYKYISAEFARKYKDENGETFGFTVLGAALTNVNFLRKGMLPVTLMEANTGDYISIEHKQEQSEDNEMDLTQFEEILNLQEASEEDVLSAVKELTEKNAELENSKVELEEKVSGLESEIEELKENKEDENVELTEMQSKIKEQDEVISELSSRIKLSAAEKVIDSAVQEGKLLPKQRDEWIELHVANAKQTEKLIQNMSKVIEFKESGTDSNEGENRYEDPTIELSEKSKKLAAEENISLSEAQNKILKTDKDLAERYKNLN